MKIFMLASCISMCVALEPCAGDSEMCEGADSMLATNQRHSKTLLDASGGSPNGKYYACDTVSDGYCTLTVTTEGAAAMGDLAGTGNFDNSDTHDAYSFAVADGSGQKLAVSPMPWIDGTQLINEQIDDYNDYAYAMAFQMVYELRNKLMYSPESVSEEDFDTYTQVFDDCGIKQTSDGGALGVADLKQLFFSSEGVTSHHSVLQFLEEGVIDLVCLMIDVQSSSTMAEFERCETVREHLLFEDDTKLCGCWFDAYHDIVGYEPKGLDADDYTTCGEGEEEDDATGDTGSDEGDAGGDHDATHTTNPPTVTAEPPSPTNPPSQGKGGKGGKGN